MRAHAGLMVLASRLSDISTCKELDNFRNIPALPSGQNQTLLFLPCFLYPFSLDGFPSCVEELDAQGSQSCSAFSFSRAS